MRELALRGAKIFRPDLRRMKTGEGMQKINKKSKGVDKFLVSKEEMWKFVDLFQEKTPTGNSDLKMTDPLESEISPKGWNSPENQ